VLTKWTDLTRFDSGINECYTATKQTMLSFACLLVRSFYSYICMCLHGNEHYQEKKTKTPIISKWSQTLYSFSKVIN